MKRFLCLFGVLVAFITCTKSPFENSNLQSEDVLEYGNYRVPMGIAIDRAREAMQELSDKEVTRVGDLSVARVQVIGSGKSQTRSGNAIDTLFYLINFANERGYALVAADERNTDVYMLSEEGSLDLDNLNPESPISYFLDCASNYAMYEITSIPPRDSLPSSSIIGENASWIEEYDGKLYRCTMETTAYSRSCFTTTQWHQQAPYNNKCFTDDGLPAYAGCVAIAMAQMMAYHQYPTSYNWDAMLTGPTVSLYDEEGADAVSTLVADVGDMAQVEYGAIEEDELSGSNIAKACLGFWFLGYRTGEVESYTFDRVKDDVSASRPVFICGMDANGGSDGHAWVIDGIQYKQSVTTYRDPDTSEFAFTTTSAPFECKVRNNVGGTNCAPVWTLSGIFEYYGYDYSRDNQIITSVEPNI